MAKVKLHFKEGDEYGRLTVLSSESIYRVSEKGRKIRHISCMCVCGTETIVTPDKLVSGHTTSCGCFGRERLKESSITHGLCGEPLFDVWRSIIARCDNPKDHRYPYYGARGIDYPVAWKDYHSFMDEMYPTYEEGLTLDRIDVNGSYSKENCRWVDMGVQGHNRRPYEGCSSTYTGVAACGDNWNTYINFQKKRCYLHVWADEQDAAKAYDDASEALYGDRPNKTEAQEDMIKEKVLKKLRSKGFIK